MSVSVVNGYLCFSSCDQATARSGRDPHPKSALADSKSSYRTGRVDGSAAVTFGGTLASLNTGKVADGNSLGASAATGGNADAHAAKSAAPSNLLDITV